MKGIDSHFLALGALYLVIGLALGIHMGIAHDHRYAPVHAHINLMGFTLHTLFALVYRNWSTMKDGLLAKGHAILFIAGAPLLMIGIVLSMNNVS